jgi:hypothetical protein
MSSIADRSVSRLWFVLVISLILMVAVPLALHADAYKPLTMDEAKSYIAKVGPDEVAREIIAYDWIQHATPVVQVPAFIAILKGRDLVWGWEGPLVVAIPAPDPTADPYLLYQIDLKSGEMKGFAPPDRKGEVILWEILAGVVLAGGVTLGVLLAK